MTSSKSSQTTRNVIIALLGLWSIISLIIIVVWATSPDMKGASQCRAELHALQDKFDEEKSVWKKDRLALEAMVLQGRYNQSVLLNHTAHLNDDLKKLNLSLESCLEENAILKENITSLEERIELHKAVEANLTANISQQLDLIENLQMNLTQTISELESCKELRKADRFLQTAAEKQTEACSTRKQYLEKQLIKCQKQAQEHHQGTGSENNGPPGPQSTIAMVMMLATALFLIP